jgi:hypothetical protein
MLGCDPEFVLVGPGGVANLANVVEKKGPIGYDHNGLVGEVHPEPCRGTYSLCKHIQTQIKTYAKPIVARWPNHRWKAGAIYESGDGGYDHRLYTMGGHVHIDYPRTDSRFAPALKAMEMINERLHDLDILPKIENKIRTTQGIYGRKGSMDAVRVKGANNERWEYRNYSSWLFDPKVAYLVLTLSKLASADAEGVMESFNETSYASLVKCLERYKGKDVNVDRLLDRVMTGSLKSLQVDPDTNVLEAWQRLGF